MRSILKIALGIIAAIGGFVDIGDIVFNSQARLPVSPDYARGLPGVA